MEGLPAFAGPSSPPGFALSPLTESALTLDLRVGDVVRSRALPSVEAGEVMRVLRLVRLASNAAHATVTLRGEGGAVAECISDGRLVSDGVELTLDLMGGEQGTLGRLQLTRDRAYPWDGEDWATARDGCQVLARMLLAGAEKGEAQFLRAQNQQLVKAIEQSEDGMILLSPDRRVEWVNNAFLEIVELERREVEGRRLPELQEMHPTLGVLRDLDASCEIGMETRYERMRGRRNGARLWLSVVFSVVRNELGVVTHYAAVGRDVTTSREREFQLRRLSSAIHASSEGIAVIDDARRFVVVNEAFARLHGEATADVLIGTSWFDAMRAWTPLERLHDIEFAVESTMQWGGIFERGEDVAHVRVVRHAITRLGDGGWIIGAHDVTEESELQQALVRARDQAEATSQAQANFVAVVSHELRTPLNAIIGFSNILMKRAAATVPIRERDYLEKIHGSGRTLLRIIDGILTHARVTRGQLRMTPAAVDVSHLLREVVAAHLAEAEARGVSMTLELPDGVLAMRLDALRMRQVLGYLVHNAVKFTQAGGVTVRLLLGDEVIVEVEDTGIGIPEDRVAGVFKPFAQAEAGMARTYGGTGLGLAVAKSLCDLMGFQLSVRSMVGVGSCFAVRMPWSARADAAETASLPDTVTPL